jgi:ubiquinone/menaquinone biosynthesis C-methylase UbiE
MATVLDSPGAPFDAVAADYDRTFSSSSVGQAQRAAVWKELAQTFFAGQRVLDIGCGTGVDACFLAARGVSVTAVDSSPVMISISASQVRSLRLCNVDLHVLKAEQISKLGSEQPFDGAFSNFGSLNCLEDLTGLAISLAQLLKPGAPLVLCMFGRYCGWEIGWYLVHGKLRKAVRRFSKGPIVARLSEGTSVMVYYPSIKSLIRQLSPEFQLKQWKGIGITVPPSYAEAWAKKHPVSMRWMIRADSALEKIPVFRACADHILLRFERTVQVGGRA